MTLDPVFASPAYDAGPIRAPEAPEGADLLVKANPHDERFWDRHPEVHHYKIEMKAGVDHADRWNVLVWLDAMAAPAARRVEPGRDIPDRPADVVLLVHTGDDHALLGRHPDLLAWRVDIALNEDGPGAVRRLDLWLSPQGAQDAP